MYMDSCMLEEKRGYRKEERNDLECSEAAIYYPEIIS